MYWCNCIESWKAKGRKFIKSQKMLGYSCWHKIETKNGDECAHCGHTAFYSKTDPNRTGNEGGAQCSAG